MMGILLAIVAVGSIVLLSLDLATGLKPSTSRPPASLGISNPFVDGVDRRHVLQSALLGAASGTGLVSLSPSLSGKAIIVRPKAAYASQNSMDSNFQVYKVIPDSSETLDPTIASVRRLPSMATSYGALWLGEHHNSVKDHNLQARLIREIHQERQKDATTKRNMAIGLEQVQIKFQSVLDDYVNGRIAASDMRRLVEWDKRWSWSFEGYLPIFEVAREYKIPLLALNVNTEDLAMVEKKGGLQGLSRQMLDFYIPDRLGFASFARSRSFSSYVDYVVRPSYDLHRDIGLLKRTIGGETLDEDMNFRTFLSGRLLWDETMASRAHAWTMANPTGLLVGLVGADHVKFQSGIPGRYARMMASSSSSADATSGPRRRSGCCVSVLLNPTLIDTRPPGSAMDLDDAASAKRPDQITLQLRYYSDNVDIKTATRADLALPSSTGGVLPLSDYLVIGD